MIRIATLTVLLLAATAALGATDTENISWYDVEVLIFKNNPPAAEPTEIWPVDPGLPGLESAVELLPPALSNPLPGSPQPFQQLDEGELTLKAVENKLASSPNYAPLVHLAWRQPVNIRADAPAVHVYSEDSAGAVPQDETVTDVAQAIDGSIRISRNRFLHVDVDLLYREIGTPEPTLFNFGGNEAKAPELFHLQQSRRINSGELHYFDHPAFGLLVKLTPYEVPGQKDSRGKPR